MKRTLIALGAAMACSSAFAASDFVDVAQVISAKPIIERVSDARQECTPAPAPQRSGASNVIAPILGGVVGGLIGHQIGGGSGQTAATIVGATGGAVAGSAINNRAGSQQPEQQCRTVETSREVVNGYDVVYRYNGRDVSVALPYNPGSTIKVGVSAVLDDRSAEVRRDERDFRPEPYDSRRDDRARRRGPPY
jgi:uncharacterized protein YcfJ